MSSKIIGLTGGIGSGKSLVAQYFMQLGIPVYNSDYIAKELMQNDLDLQQKIIALLGHEAYNENKTLNRAYIAQKIFNQENLLKALNEIVHPAVRQDFKTWVTQQTAQPYLIQEAAILYESGAYKHCDAVILVTADEKIRIERVMKRDNISEEAVRARMKNQLTDAEKYLKADYIILNNGDTQTLKNQVILLHDSSLKKNLD